MYYALDSQIRFCHLGDDFVFLDLSLGRYFGLGRDQSDAFRRFIRADGFITAQDQHILRGLIERGSLAPCNKGGSPGIKCQLESPRTEINQAPKFHGFLVQVARAVWRQIRMTSRIRARPIAELLEEVRPTPTVPWRQGAEVGDEVRRVACAYARTDLLLGKTDRCLVRSLAMFDELRSRNIATRLVFGVRIAPFTAHCWVQRDGMVLNDSVENVKDFTPILVV